MATDRIRKTIIRETKSKEKIHLEDSRRNINNLGKHLTQHLEI